MSEDPYDSYIARLDPFEGVGSDPGEGSLEQAKQQFQASLENGDTATCPCCERLARIRPRTLNSGMARMLIALYKFTRVDDPEDGWIHVSKEFLKRQQNAVAKEYSKLRYWGLLESKANTNPETPGSGFWRVTGQGIAFVEGRIRVPRKVYSAEPAFEGRIVGMSEELTSIQEAVGDSFDYQELMQPVVLGA